MTEIHPFIVFLGGVVVVLLGSELILRGAASIAVVLKVKPIIVGLTIVAVGTSTPELAVGLTAVAEGTGALSVGNIAGANILNILFILGLSAALRPLPIRRRSVKLDVPAMILAALALILMSMDGVLTRTDGALLVLAAVAYTVILARTGRSESPQIKREFAEEYGTVTAPARTRAAKLVWFSVLLAGGIAIAMLGADLLVAGAVDMAKALGVSNAIIGLTIVAMGTSSPELATALLATYKNDRDVAIGNLIGSSIYNILAILGLIMLAAPQGVNVARDILWIDLPLAALVAIVCYPVFKSERLVSRKEGIYFVAAYSAYLATLLLFRT